MAFYSNAETLKKVPVMGGTPVLLSEGESPLGATWEGGRILFGQPTPPAIIEIPENGGAANPLVTLNEKTGEQARSPQLVAGGRAVLFTLRMREAKWDDASFVHELARQAVGAAEGDGARVLPTGHLVYARAGTIFAVPFDEKRLMVTGGPVPVQQGIQTPRATGTSHVAWSSSGTFAIAQGSMAAYMQLLVLGQSGRPRGAYGTASPELRDTLIGVARVAGRDSRRGDDLFGRRLGLGRRRRLRGLGG